jgi:hypothetical protein
MSKVGRRIVLIAADSTLFPGCSGEINRQRRELNLQQIGPAGHDSKGHALT